MFIGREGELADLAALWRKRTSSLAVVSGRRRIGTSTLVERFAADSKCRFVEIAGLTPDREMTNQKQLDHFCERLALQTGVPEVRSGMHKFKSMENLAGWNTVKGLQFENMILNNLPSQWIL